MDSSQYLGIFLDEAREFHALLSDKLLLLEGQGGDRKALDEIFRAAHTLKGMSAAMGFSGLTELTHQMEDVLEELRHGAIALDAALTDTLLAGVDGVGTMIDAIADGQVDVASPALLERLAGAVLECRRTKEDRSGPFPSVTARSSPGEGSAGAPGSAKPAPSLRISAERLDALVNLVGELVVERTRLQQLGLGLGHKEIEAVIGHLGSVITDVHGVVMKLRLTPVEHVFSRFPRMVRDLGRELKKDVKLVVEGEETELDRLILDEIAEPLLHLLRNALDHGLESTLERELLGKNPTGTIWLRSRHEASQVLLEVEDDGKGMDLDRLKRRAVDKGLISSEEAGRLTDKQALELIFLPGFSTRDTATDISGRGVGLDAVKSKTASLGGSLDIATTYGKGTRITLRLPLTLAILPCVLTEVGTEIYALPSRFVEDARDLLDNLPMVGLRELVAAPKDSPPPPKDAAVVVVRVGTRHCGLVVDRLLGQQDLVIKPISKLIGPTPPLSGATILADGKLALVLDASTLLGEEELPVMSKAFS